MNSQTKDVNKCKLAHCRCMQITPCGNHHYSDCGWVFDNQKQTEPKELTGLLEELDKEITAPFNLRKLSFETGRPALMDNLKFFITKTYNTAKATGYKEGKEAGRNEADWMGENLLDARKSGEMTERERIIKILDNYNPYAMGCAGCRRKTLIELRRLESDILNSLGKEGA